MDLLSGPRVSGLFGILGIFAAFPPACSDPFQGCKATRTCPRSPEDGGEGGENGATGGTGGSSGGTTGGGPSGGSAGAGGSAGVGAASGAAGASGAGGSDDGGAGGENDDTERPTIVSFAPEDGASNVERDVTVTIELSEPIDEASVTSSSVRLLGLDGDVAGTLKVTKSTITFVPDVPLSLLETYTITLTDGIADLAGNTLADDASAEFRVRDGRWGTPVFPFGTEVARPVTAFARNAGGDVVIGMGDGQTFAAAYAASYEAEQNTWSEVTPIPGAVGTPITIAVDDSRRAALIWCCRNSQSEWARLTTQGAWVGAGPVSVPRLTPFLGVTRNGSAIVAWGSGTGMTSIIMDLVNGIVDGPSLVYVADGFGYSVPVTSLNRIGLIAVSQSELGILWKEGSLWSEPQTLAASDASISDVKTDGDEFGNVIVAWRQGDELWARIYERARDQWTPGHRVGTITSLTTVMLPDMTTGHAIVAAEGGADSSEGILVGIYNADAGWLESSVTHLDSHGGFASAGLTIDPAGNALAVWNAELKYRRYVAGQGWQDPGSLEANVDSFRVFSAEAPDGSVLVVANDRIANPNGIAMAVRFE